MADIGHTFQVKRKGILKNDSPSFNDLLESRKGYELVRRSETPTVNSIPKAEAVEPDSVVPDNRKLIPRVPMRYPEISISETPGLREALLDAQLMIESNYNNEAVSPAGAKGIAQFMPATFKELQDRGYLPPEASIENENDQIKAQYHYMFGRLPEFEVIQDSVDDLDRIERTLAAYNAGPGRVATAVLKAKRAGNPSNWKAYLPRETREYIPKVLDRMFNNLNSTNFKSNYNWEFSN